LANDPAPGLIRLTPADALRVDTSNMLCSDVLLGLRMDLNRPFGDGQDNNGNNVVDEPFVDMRPQGVIPPFEGVLPYAGLPPIVDKDANMEYRQRYARTLYVLMMALVDKDWYPIWDSRIARKLEGVDTDPITPTDKAMARAQAIAQWAVNVVDFRDSDSVMTPFEYDIYPFHASRPWQPGEAITTWDVDGVIDSRNIPTDPNYNPNWEPTRGVVWGCERPELLITETFATHDRRQYNVSSDPNDPEYVNKFRPEGSLFVELYNPWSEAEARPAEFYGNVSSNPNTAGVRLNQTSPVGGSPVWRLAIYDLADAADGDGMPQGLGYRDPHDESLAKPPTLERLVYFVPDTGNLPEAVKAKVTFSSSAADLAPVMPRRYAVVGPSNPASAQYPAGATLLGAPPAVSISALRRIVLNPNPDPTSTGQVQVFSNGTVDDLATLATAIQPPVAVAIDKARAGAAGAVKDLRLSISEPVDGYLADGDPNYNWATGYVTPQPAEDVYRGDDWGADVSGDTPVWRGPLGTAGCTPALRYVHLQRLANPLLPYHDTTNPYMSIDSAPVDLTVFDSQMNAGLHAWGVAGTYPPGGSLISRQRGQDKSAAKSAAFWTALVVPEPTDPTDGPPKSKNTKPLPAAADPTNLYFRGDLGHSLGYLNDFFFDQSPLDQSKFSLPPVYAGAPGAEAGSSGSLTFTPDPLPWLTWLNRPFANPLELLQVPALHSSRLLLSYENDVTKAPEVYTSGKESFAHLGPFFSAFAKDNQTQKNSGKLRGVTGEDATLWTSLVPNFYRLLEYVHVPSRFVDAQVQGNPGLMNNPGEPHVFHPPFNFIPTYREPGKINLNTIFDHRDDLIGNLPIYRALANDHPLPSWDRLCDRAPRLRVGGGRRP
jgi:hypothetical protein